MRIYTKDWLYGCKITGEKCGEFNQLPPICIKCEFYLNWKKSGLSIKKFASIKYCNTCNIELTKENKSMIYDNSCKKCVGGK